MTDSLTARQEIMRLLIGAALTRDEILRVLEVDKVGTEEKTPYLKALGNMQTRGDLIRRNGLRSGSKPGAFKLTHQGLGKASQEKLVCPSCGGPADIDNLGADCTLCLSQCTSVIKGEKDPGERVDEEQSDLVEVIVETKMKADKKDALLELVDQGMDLRHIPNVGYHGRVLRKISEWPALDQGVANWMASLADLLEGRATKGNA